MKSLKNAFFLIFVLSVTSAYAGNKTKENSDSKKAQREQKKGGSHRGAGGGGRVSPLDLSDTSPEPPVPGDSDTPPANPLVKTMKCGTNTVDLNTEVVDYDGKKVVVPYVNVKNEKGIVFNDLRSRTEDQPLNAAIQSEGFDTVPVNDSGLVDISPNLISINDNHIRFFAKGAQTPLCEFRLVQRGSDYGLMNYEVIAPQLADSKVFVSRVDVDLP